MKRNLSSNCFNIVKDLNLCGNEPEEIFLKKVKLNDMLKRINYLL